MTKFLQRLQLALWAAAIVQAIVIQFMGLGGELTGVPAVATYIFNMVGVVLLLMAGYFVLAQRKHRVVRMVVDNAAILCTEALYFMMKPEGTTMMYCFLIALLLSLVAYPIKEPAVAVQEAPAEEPAEAEVEAVSAPDATEPESSVSALVEEEEN